MKTLLFIFITAITFNAQAFWGLGCEDKSNIPKEFNSLREEADALRIEQRNQEFHETAQKVLDYLQLETYKINPKDSYFNFTHKKGKVACEIYAKKSKDEICIIDCLNSVPNSWRTTCHKKGTTGKNYIIPLDKL